jgi:segregation and condensation protein B
VDFLSNHIEALIFSSPEALKIDDMHSCLIEMFATDIPTEHIQEALLKIEQKYLTDDFSYALYQHAEGYQFLTKPAYQASIKILLKQASKKRLSTSSIETLAIIAYKQPISKGQIEQIRGVNCDYAVQKLLEKGLIEIWGKSDAVGRPLIYGTSPKFMDYFGLKNLNELPQPKDIAPEENEIGKPVE